MAQTDFRNMLAAPDFQHPGIQHCKLVHAEANSLFKAKHYDEALSGLQYALSCAMNAYGSMPVFLLQSLAEACLQGNKPGAALLYASAALALSGQVPYDRSCWCAAQAAEDLGEPSSGIWPLKLFVQTSAARTKPCSDLAGKINGLMSRFICLKMEQRASDGPEAAFTRCLLRALASQSPDMWQPIVPEGTPILQSKEDVLRVKEEGDKAWGAGDMQQAIVKWQEVLLAFKLLPQLLHKASVIMITANQPLYALRSAAAVMVLHSRDIKAFSVCVQAGRLLRWAPEAKACMEAGLRAHPTDALLLVLRQKMTSAEDNVQNSDL
jgi:hypothetical protein